MNKPNSQVFPDLKQTKNNNPELLLTITALAVIDNGYHKSINLKFKKN